MKQLKFKQYTCDYLNKIQKTVDIVFLNDLIDNVFNPILLSFGFRPTYTHQIKVFHEENKVTYYLAETKD